ncbi:FAD-binding protein [Streptomyces sp. enrichment culture]|uniref:FAD-dependent oxidoreductase n=1 Tax=Streptomyces sp. enrichment culture TaxID=1795815 RepID=UPI003F5463BA
MAADTVPLTGWGRTAPTVARLVRPRTYQEAVAAVRDCGARGGIPRGLGRAHGDAAQNAGGSVFDVTGLDRVHAIDAGEGTVLCDAGVSLHHLTRVLLPLGWLPPVAPAARHITVGGAIGADVHGPDHPAAGSFCRHVRALELLTADGEVRTAVPGTPLFEATAGGMGLTGVVLTATLRLQPVETSLLTVGTERAADLDDLMDRLTGGGHRYTAARLDLRARGAATGRALLTRGDHAPLDALPPRARRDPLAVRPRRAPTGRLQPLSAFFHHPFDGLRHRVHARRALVRYQFVVPYGQEETLRRIVTRLSARRRPSFPAVLQRFGESGPGLLSFPAPGWTLALDLPARLPGLAALLDTLDEEVAAAGGRVCLAEDSRLRPDLLPAMYPRLAGFRALRAGLDPRGVFVSDLSRRLGL